MREKITHIGTYVFSALGAILEFCNSNAAGLSVLIALAGYLTSTYYKRRADKRAAQAEAEGRLVEMIKGD